MDMVTTGRHFTSSPETAEPPLNTELDELMERHSFARATSLWILVFTSTRTRAASPLVGRSMICGTSNANPRNSEE
jgi:hypothetical protein